MIDDLMVMVNGVALPNKAVLVTGQPLVNNWRVRALGPFRTCILEVWKGYSTTRFET
jgi:hypothetical protein